MGKNVYWGGQWCLTYDPLNDVCYQEGKIGWVLILGNAMDTLEWHMNLRKIAIKCLQKATVSMEDFYDYIDYLNGRHIIMLGIRGKIILFQDATGMRSVYFHRNKFAIASHYNLVNDYVKDSRHPFMADFIAMKGGDPWAGPWMMPGNITPYSNIVSLQPNHALDCKTMAAYRFWPRKRHDEVSFDEAMDYIASHIKKQMEVITKYYKVMMQLTKGNDSRISLAAAKEVRGELLFYNYYLNNDVGTIIDRDYARNVSKELNLNYKDVDVTLPGVSKEEYEKLKSVAYFNSYHLHAFSNIGNFIEKLPSDRITIRSNIIEVIRSADSYFGWFSVDDFNYMDMAKAYYWPRRNDSKIQFIWKAFYEENQWDKIYNYFPWDLFYWEYRMGTWMSQGVVLKDDWNFDTYMLFNCRKLLECGLSVNHYYAKGGYVPAAIVKRLWPQLFFDIPNTDYNLLEGYYFDQNEKSEMISNFKIDTEGPSKEIKTYVQLGRSQGVLGFSLGSVKKDDTVSLGNMLSVSRDGNYHLQVNFSVPKRDYQDPYCSICKIELGNVNIAFDLNACGTMENKVDVILPCKAGEISLKIKLISVKDVLIKRGVPGVIIVKSIYFHPTDRYVQSKAGFDVYSTIGLN